VNILEAVENIIEHNISTHAKTRYAERIMGKEDIDVTRFVVLNEEKIKTDINKLIHYGQLIYTGKQAQRDGKNNVVNVFLNGCWIILVDSKINNVITLFKIDLGLDDEFNKMYISKMLEKLNTNKEVLESVQRQVEIESNAYREMIAEAEAQIKEYRGMIKNLEELSAGYKTILDNNSVKVAQANRNVAEILNTFIGKKEF
jgi:hypothetical protein